MTWSVEAARVRIGLEPDDDTRDAQLQTCLDVALAAAESYCDRKFLKMEDSEEIFFHMWPAFTVRRWPLDSLVSIQQPPPLPDPEPEALAVPASWRMDKKKGIVFAQGSSFDILPVGTVPVPGFGLQRAFTLTYVGGFDPLPADLEAALWMVFDAQWWATPGWGAVGGAAPAGLVRSFGIDGMTISYDTAAGASAGEAKGWGVLPAMSAGILDFYRAESAAIGG